MPSATTCRSPNGPTRVGPTRPCIRPNCLRSSQTSEMPSVVMSVNSANSAMTILPTVRAVTLSSGSPSKASASVKTATSTPTPTSSTTAIAS